MNKRKVAVGPGASSLILICGGAGAERADGADDDLRPERRGHGGPQRGNPAGGLRPVRRGGKIPGGAGRGARILPAGEPGQPGGLPRGGEGKAAGGHEDGGGSGVPGPKRRRTGRWNAPSGCWSPAPEGDDRGRSTGSTPETSGKTKAWARISTTLDESRKNRRKRRPESGTRLPGKN